MSSTRSTPTRAQRLDVLPFTREHRRLLLGSGTGWALDALDVGLVSFIIAQLTVQWRLTPGEASWIASIGFVGMAIGAAVGGLLADRLGRRQVFALTLLVYGLVTGLSALSCRSARCWSSASWSGWGWARSCRWPPPWSASSPRPGSAAGWWCCSSPSGRSAGRWPR